MAVESLRLMREPSLSGGLAAWSAALFAAGVLGNWLTARALGVPLDHAKSALLAADQRCAAHPHVGRRIGLFHDLCILSPGIYAIGREQALGYALVLHVLTYLPMAVVGPLAVWRETRGRGDVRALLRGRDPGSGAASGRG